jgi:hypothetical protein
MRTIPALLAALAAGTFALAGAPAHAATCQNPVADPLGCTPPPPAPVRGLARYTHCDVTAGPGGLVVTADAEVPFATSVTIRCAGNTDWGYVDVTSTTPGQVGVLAERIPGVYPAGTGTADEWVSWTYSDGTGGPA